VYEDATQVFGGRALTVTGMGKYIENVSSRSFSLAVTFGHCQFFGGVLRSLSILVSMHQVLTGCFFFWFWIGYSTTAPQASMQVSDVLFFALVLRSQSLGLGSGLRFTWKVPFTNMFTFASQSSLVRKMY